MAPKPKADGFLDPTSVPDSDSGGRGPQIPRICIKRNKEQIRQINEKITELNPTESIITFNINCLDALIKRQRLLH